MRLCFALCVVCSSARAQVGTSIPTISLCRARCCCCHLVCCRCSPSAACVLPPGRLIYTLVHTPSGEPSHQ